MNSGSSAFIGSGGQSALALRHQLAGVEVAASTIGTRMPVCRNISTLTSGAHFSSALSAFSLSGTAGRRAGRRRR